MKLLIITQKVDVADGMFGLFHRWLAEFAKQVPKLTVICLARGEFHLPENVEVLSLGKEDGRSRLKYLFNFYRYIWQKRHDYDAVFVHMNQIYVILGGIFWRLSGKKIGLWYAHGSTPFGLKIAEKITNIIFTSTRSGCRLPSRKIKIVGQGIDTEKFRRGNGKTSSAAFRIVSVGRISPVKDYETLIAAADTLRGRGFDFKVTIVGGVGLPEHQTYLDGLKTDVNRLGLSDRITFSGPLTNDQIVPILQSSDILVSTSQTGSFDRAMGEAMAVELPVLSCNEALPEVLGQYKNVLMYPPHDSNALAGKLSEFLKMAPEKRAEIGRALREIVVRDHDVTKLVAKILKEYQQ